MSLDIYLPKLRDGRGTPLNEKELLRVQSVIDRWVKSFSPTELTESCYQFSLPDGYCEMDIGNITNLQAENVTISFAIRGFSRTICELIHEIAIAGDFTIWAAMEQPSVFLTSESLLKHFENDPKWDDELPIVCKSPDELFQYLSRGATEFAEYLDHVKRTALKNEKENDDR